jgi:hypothetical protein
MPQKPVKPTTKAEKAEEDLEDEILQNISEDLPEP